MNEEKTASEEMSDHENALVQENMQLRRELALREEQRLQSEQLAAARQSMAQCYPDFTRSLAAVEEIIAQTEGISDLAPAIRYRIGYLMHVGAAHLAAKNEGPTDEELLAALKRRPALLRAYVQANKESKALPRFSHTQSAGIRRDAEKMPQNLAEARHAALRYMKTR